MGKMTLSQALAKVFGLEYSRIQFTSDLLPADVRQYDAHAWSEVWLEDRGWIRIDPTAAVAPGRIEYGSQFVFQEDENFLEGEVFSMLKYRGASALINDLILRMEMVDYAWN